jgi:hypothetical protein
MNQFAGTKIEDFDESVILCGKEQPVALEVDGKMVKIAVLKPCYGNGLQKLKRCFVLSLNANQQNKKRHDQSGGSQFTHHRSSSLD